MGTIGVTSLTIETVVSLQQRVPEVEQIVRVAHSKVWYS